MKNIVSDSNVEIIGIVVGCDVAEKIISTTMIPLVINLKVASAYPIDYEDPPEMEFLINDPLKPALETLFNYGEDTTIISVAAAGNFRSEYAYPFACTL